MKIIHHGRHNKHHETRASALTIQRDMLRKELEAVHLQMEKIGSYIARLRKAMGLTQGRLAETLGVSPQAVSNWERGDSLPDASQWIPLSQALGTSVELLLYGGELPEDEAANSSAETKTEPIAAEPVIMKEEPPIAEENDDEEEEEDEDDEEEDEADEEDDDAEDSRSFDPNDPWEQVIALAPFVSREGMDALVHKACEGEKPDWDKIEKLAPFLSRDALRELSKKAFAGDKPNWKALRKLAPMLGKDALSEIIEASAYSRNLDLDELVKLAPFLNRNELAKLLHLATKGRRPDLNVIRKLAPFLPRSVIDDYVLHAVEGKPWQPKDEPKEEHRRNVWPPNLEWTEDANEVLENVQREVGNAIRQGFSMGQSGWQAAREAIRDTLGNLFPDDEGKDQ